MLLLIPFFELYSISMLMSMRFHYAVFYGIDRIYAASRWAVSLMAILVSLFYPARTGCIVKLTILLSLVRCFAVFMNRMMTLGFLIGCITYIGFALMVSRMLRKRQEYFILACAILFTVLSYLGAVSVLLFPGGFFRVAESADAVYFLGSKNFGFYFYYLSVFFLVLLSLSRGKKECWLALVSGVFYCIAAYRADSVNTLLCIGIFVFYLAVKHLLLIYHKLFHTRNVLIVFFGMLFVILYGKRISLIVRIMNFFGRNMSFTGRDYIWERVIPMIQASPLWGAGYEMMIILPSGVSVNHAHNFFLDNFAKYGVVEFLILLAMIFGSAWFIVRKKGQKDRVFLAVSLFVVLLHSLFDDVSIYIWCMVLITFELFRNTGDDHEKRELRTEGFTTEVKNGSL